MTIAATQTTDAPDGASTARFGAHAPPPLVRAIIDITRRAPDTWLGRRVSLALRGVAIRALRGRPVDIEALGARMRLHPYRNVCEKKILFTPHFFDAREREIIASRIRPGFVFLDIGANVGGYTMFVASLAGAGARILAIEPQPDIFDRLVANIRFNPGGNVKALDCALADRAGELTLFVNARNRGESSVKIVGASAAETIRVPAKTLHDLAREEGFERIDAVKLDVEGAEDLILEPFLRDAPEGLWPRLLVIERGEGRWGIDLPGLLEASGYRMIEATRMNLVFERGAGGEPA